MKLSRLTRNKDAKTLASNFAWLSVLQVATYVFPLITIPYLARVIGVDGFGKIAFAAAVILWVQTITDWGFNFTATRDIAKNKNNIKVISEIFSNVLWARILIMLLCLIVLMILVAVIPVFKENSVVIFVTFLLIPGRISCPEWFFQGMEQMKFITLVNIIAKLVFTLCVFIFVKTPDDYIIQPLLSSLGYICSGIVAFWIIMAKFKVQITRPDFQDIFKTLKNSTDVFINTFMPNLYNSFSVILLGSWGGPSANGLLDAGMKFTAIAERFLQVISRTFFPYLSRSTEKHSLFAKGYLLAAVFVALVLFFMSPLLIKIFYTPEFEPAVLLCRLSAISLIFMILNNIYGTNYLIVKGYDRNLRNITIISSLIGFAISFPMIYFFDYLGAMLTIVFTRALLGLGMTYEAKRLMRRE